MCSDTTCKAYTIVGTTIMYCATLLSLLALLSGCAEVSRIMGSTWHEKCSWVAEDYFDDPKVISLCKAIEANDLEEIDRLVAAGADVNAQGKGKMTPLLWAFPDNKLARFERLLQHGANPNVIIESDFNTRGGMLPGDSVTHMAARTYFPGYCKTVFEHGGDPNLPRLSRLGSGDTPIFSVIKFGSKDKIKDVRSLIDKGADLNHLNESGTTPTMMAVGRGQYEIALMLLEAGANPRIYQGNQMMKLVHVVNRQETLLPNSTAQQYADYQKLVKWLEDHGESIEEAKADEARWKSWGGYGLEKKAKLMEQEKRKRLAKEAREKQADDEGEQDNG